MMLFIILQLNLTVETLSGI